MAQRGMIGIIIGGRFPAAYRTLEGLAEAGMEGRLVTSHPRSRLPRYAFPPCWLSTCGGLEYFYRAIERIPGVRELVPAQWLKLALLDVFARRVLRQARLVNGWSGMCARSFLAAKKRGAVTILQTGSAHAGVQKAILEKELGRHGLSSAVTSEKVLARQLMEYALADHIVVPSLFVRRTFLEAGVTPGKVHVIPEGVDCANLRPLPKRDQVFRVLYIGHLSFRKGVFHLLEAARKLQRSGMEFMLRGALEPAFGPVLAGYRGIYREAAAVPAGGFADFISQASVVVVPSIEDGWCAVTVEAMACGVPVIVSTNTGSADAVRNGQEGFLVPAGDADVIAERLRWLQCHPEECTRMGRAARERVQDYTWEIYRRRIAKFMAAALDGTFPSAPEQGDTP